MSGPADRRAGHHGWRTGGIREMAGTFIYWAVRRPSKLIEIFSGRVNLTFLA